MLKTKILASCIICGKKVSNYRHKYCSYGCYWKKKIGENPPADKENCNCFRCNPIGDHNSYFASHNRLLRSQTKSGVCEQCNLPHHRTHWANKSGNYHYDNPNDWIELCPSCHKKYDMKKMITLSKSCAICKTSFVTLWKHKIYCSHKCKKKAYNQRKTDNTP